MDNKLGEFKYIDSLSDNQIRVIIRAIMWPSLSDEEILDSQAPDYSEKVHSDESWNRFKTVENLFPERLVKEVKFMDLGTKFIFVQQTTSIPLQIRVDDHVKKERVLVKIINEELEKLGATSKPASHG